MDKLTWFKFMPSDWMMGKIQKCPVDTRGMFMNLCCLYWNKECNLTYEDAEIEIDEHIDVLIKKKIVFVEGEKIKISFLDEQMEDILETSDKRRDAANKRWNKKNASAMQKNASAYNSNANAMQNDADKIREDKRREEKEIILSFEDFWSKYPSKVAKQKCKEKYSKLKDNELQAIKDTIGAFVKYKPFEGYTHPNPLTYLNQKRWEDEIPETEKPREQETMEETILRIKKERGWIS